MNSIRESRATSFRRSGRPARTPVGVASKRAALLAAGMIGVAAATARAEFVYTSQSGFVNASFTDIDGHTVSPSQDVPVSGSFDIAAVTARSSANLSFRPRADGFLISGMTNSGAVSPESASAFASLTISFSLTEPMPYEFIGYFGQLPGPHSGYPVLQGPGFMLSAAGRPVGVLPVGDYMLSVSLQDPLDVYVFLPSPGAASLFVSAGVMAIRRRRPMPA